MKKETLCVHSGTYRDDITGGINTPIFTSSATSYLDREKAPYPRYFNTPNQEAVVSKLCALEGAQAGVLFSSGMAAMSTAIMTFARAGDHVVLMDELYGGTHSFATDDFKNLGISHTFAATDADALCRAATKDTRVMVIESPTNPLLSIIDIRKVAEFARAKGIITIIDNTFASPILQNPISLGIDIVVHSGTKYLGGHSDLCCGAMLASKDRAESVRMLARHLGGSLNAPDCYLLERSLKTLSLRVERQSANAQKIAEFLEGCNEVMWVNYPGLPGFTGHDIAKKQMSGYGAMLSFDINPEKLDPNRFVRNLKLIKPAVSLGGVETTITSPALTSHATISSEERIRIGITETLFRLSVGIEHAGDIIADLKEALEG